MDGRKEWQMNGRKDGLTDSWTDGQIDRHTDSLTDLTDWLMSVGRSDGLIDGRSHKLTDGRRQNDYEYKIDEWVNYPKQP